MNYPRLITKSHLYRIALALASCVAMSDLSMAAPAWSETDKSDVKIEDLSSLSLEQLASIEVSSVARRDQQLSKTPAAVFVITHEDIRRSSATSIPELLRMVPGVQVARVEANKWAVSIRGFNGIFSDKMLVMIDGRTVYTPIYSGVFWSENDVLLEDVERIEVIRGPGATMWGANAVNGVVNVITKKAAATIGRQMVASGGGSEREGSARYGGETKAGLQYRLFFKQQKQFPLVTSTGSSANDGGGEIRGGGRADWQIDAHDWITLHGDVNRTPSDQSVYVYNNDGRQYVQSVAQDKAKFNGGYALMRWEHNTDGRDFALQAYYNNESDSEYRGSGREGTTDLDFQNHFSAGARNDVTWGVGYRHYAAHLNGKNLPFVHQREQIHLASSFLQDEFRILPDKVTFTAGSKLQWNSYTHFEVQPNLRLLWTPDSRHSIWTSVSRSVRTPSIQDRDLLALFPLPSSLPFPTTALVQGNRSIKSEVALAFEAGYRQRWGEHVSADLAGFVYSYSRLTGELQQDPYMVFSPAPALVIPLLYVNGEKGRSEGAEASLTWSPEHALHFVSSYAWMQARIKPSGSFAASVSPDQTWSTPRNALNVRGDWDFARHWTLDGALGAISRTPTYGSGWTAEQQTVPAYRRVDLDATYSFGEAISVKFGTRNLQNARHLEFNPENSYNVPTYVTRDEFVKLVWSF